VNSGNNGAVERRIEFAPFSNRNGRAGGQSHWFEHTADDDGIGREHFPDQGDCRLVLQTVTRWQHRAFGCFLPGVGEHGSGQNVLGFRVRWHSEARHVNADDAHAVDLVRQHLQRNAGRGRDTEVCNDDGVEFLRIRHLVDGLDDVFEQFAGDQCF